MKLKKLVKNMFDFDEYIRFAVYGFITLYVVGFFGNMDNISNYGLIKYFIIMFGLFVGGILFFRVVQWICRKIGFAKNYYDVKAKIKKR